MDKTVAIKVLRPSLAADETIVARFSREARAASRISHPHALSVTDFGESEDGIVFLVMEYLSGKTLKEIIHEQGPMPLSRVVEIIRQVGGALDAAHTQGIVHRDLKSDNIMLLSANGADYAKVLDFGIAKIQEAEGDYNPGLTAPNLVIGTPLYMSPEQCSQSREIDARSDVYSLGVILYEMLVGHVPFTGDSPTAIMLKHLQETAPSVLDERKDLPAQVDQVVTRALAKLPENRYQNVAGLVEDLAMAADPDLAPVTSANPVAPATAPAMAVKNVADADEQTLIRPRQQIRIDTRSPVRPQIVPQTQALNPWKIVIPSLVGLLVVFGGVWAFTRKSEPAANTNQSQPALAADPNGKPVEPAQSATGKSEAAIPAGGATTNQAVNPKVNANANTAASPSTAENINENINANTSSNANVNEANTSNKRPTPTAPLPSPSVQLNNDQPSAPAPDIKMPSPNVSPSAPAASPVTPPQ